MVCIFSSTCSAENGHTIVLLAIQCQLLTYYVVWLNGFIDSLSASPLSQFLGSSAFLFGLACRRTATRLFIEGGRKVFPIAPSAAAENMLFHSLFPSSTIHPSLTLASRRPLLANLDFRQPRDESDSNWTEHEPKWGKKKSIIDTTFCHSVVRIMTVRFGNRKLSIVRTSSIRRVGSQH